MNSKEEIERTLGHVIHAHRLEQRLTRADLARLSGMSPAGIFYIETGQRLPGSESITKIARALDMKPGELWG
jgi:transcriptional regulator with XRE-family HTH domain